MAFEGFWILDRKENYDQLLQKMGVSSIKRQEAADLKFSIEINQTDHGMTISESIGAGFMETELQFGVPFLYIMDVGIELKGTFMKEGQKLVGNFNRVDDKKEVKIVQEIIEDGLVQIYSYEGVDAKKIFRKRGSPFIMVCEASTR